MNKFDDCYWGEYFAEYSMRLCNHPKNKEHNSDANCRWCKLHETFRQHEIKKIRGEIAFLKEKLKILIEKENRK